MRARPIAPATTQNPPDSRCWLDGGGQHPITRALSNDLRERVVEAVGAGESCRAVASRFGVAVSSVVKWSQRYCATGSVAPGKMGGHRKRVLEPHRAFIVERINQTSDLTLHRLKDELAARGVTVSHNAVWMFLRREGLSYKKNAARF
ncbi:transposase [Mesorhizobium sp. M1409]|uniref:transposase n=1 Tax=unclassified Mesorhizobium TaxID=325217 RepID=UPI0033378DCC